jgi:transcriptional regulator with XRE-family HTH domain
MNTLGQVLREARAKKGWSQERLEAESNVSQANISLYESDKVTPRLPVLVRLCESLNLSLDSIIKDKKPTLETNHGGA